MVSDQRPAAVGAVGNVESLSLAAVLVRPRPPPPMCCRRRVDAEADAARERARGPSATLTELHTLVTMLTEQNKTLQAKLSLGQVRECGGTTGEEGLQIIAPHSRVKGREWRSGRSTCQPPTHACIVHACIVHACASPCLHITHCHSSFALRTVEKHGERRSLCRGNDTACIQCGR